MTTFKISEEGKNGEVTLAPTGLDRTLKRLVGKDDRQFIPYKSIAFVEHDRKRLGRDEVNLQVGNKQFSWKIQADAEGFVDLVNAAIASGGHTASASPAPSAAAPGWAPPPAAAPAPAAAPPPPPPAQPAPPTVPANWYPDPRGRHELRYHDGTRWTDHVSTAGEQSTDPVG